MRSLAFAVAALLLAFPGTSAATASGSPSNGRLEFELLRNGHSDGRHVVTITQGADGLSVRSQINIAVHIGPITAYSFQQTCSETWAAASAGALNALNCSTVKNGRRMQVAARRNGAGLQVTGTGGATVFPLNALPTSWWLRPPAMNGAMIDTQNGRALPVRVVHVGRESIQVGGQTIQADHVRVIGTMSADLWYDTHGRWVGCAFTMRGQHIQYRLISPLESAPAPA